MSAYFITGTGTDVGKTFVASLLIRQLTTAKRSVHAIKPVISGYEAEGSDTHIIATALGLPWTEDTAACLSPWRFTAPLSPHLAAERGHSPIETEELLAFCRTAIAEAKDETLLIEGAGGVMTPINPTLLTADWIAALGIPALLVVGSYLGSISHSLAAYEALVHRGIPVAGVVISESEASNFSLTDTLGSLQMFLPTDCPILALPRQAGDGTIETQTPDLTRLLT